MSRLNKLAKPLNTQADLLQKYGQAIDGLARILADQRELMRMTVTRTTFIFKKLQLNEEEYTEYEAEIRAKYDTSKEAVDGSNIRPEEAGANGSDSNIGDTGVSGDKSNRIHNGSEGIADDGQPRTVQCSDADGCTLPDSGKA